MASGGAEPLALLLNAPSPAALERLLGACYRHRGALGGLDVDGTAEAFRVTPEQATAVRARGGGMMARVAGRGA